MATVKLISSEGIMLLLTYAKFHHHNLSHSLSHPPPHFCAISGSFKISMNKNRIAGFLLPSQITYTNYKGVDPTRYTPQYIVCLQSEKTLKHPCNYLMFKRWQQKFALKGFNQLSQHPPLLLALSVFQYHEQKKLIAKRLKIEIWCYTYSTPKGDYKKGMNWVTGPITQL